MYENVTKSSKYPSRQNPHVKYVHKWLAEHLYKELRFYMSEFKYWSHPDVS